MASYLLRRLAQALVVILGVVVIVFALSQLIPGGEARAVLGPKATPLAVVHFNHQNGLDQPLWVQFWHYLLGLPQLHLGYSYARNQGVWPLIAETLPKTVVLVGLSTLLALAVALPLGVLQAVRRNRLVDHSLTTAAFVLYATPPFLLGTLLIVWLGFDLKWFPPTAVNTDSVSAILLTPRALVLPVVTLAAISIAAFSRYMRSSMLDTLTEDYIRTARAKGASEHRVLYGHALRNALLPVITLLGLTLPAIFGGAVVVETLFNYPGMGLLTVNAATQDDIPLILGTTLVATVATVLGSLLADLCYALVDPRIRLGRS
jgi:peptide/nickel transport system permease protein